ncbi:MAG: hypothetical protein H6712_25735 [Myxococcales bacterium]|nr:hypothetical protein [Myxococcales bacterium]MCB9717277.1 hypothetical protein [Myxococcales bacterium]
MGGPIVPGSELDGFVVAELGDDEPWDALPRTPGFLLVVGTRAEDRRLVAADDPLAELRSLVERSGGVTVIPGG